MCPFQTSRGGFVPTAKPLSIGTAPSSPRRRHLPLGERQRVSQKRQARIYIIAMPQLDGLQGEDFLRGRVPAPPCARIAAASKQTSGGLGSLPRPATAAVFLAPHPTWVCKTFPPCVFNQPWINSELWLDFSQPIGCPLRWFSRSSTSRRRRTPGWGSLCSL